MAIDDLDAAWALKDGQFVPHFQPLVNLRTGELQGFELLARWNHPERGWIQPEDFIPIAERDGWIGCLTGELLQQGFAAMKALPPILRLSVNISPIQLQDERLPAQFQDLAQRGQFRLERLTVEVTESALTRDVERCRSVAAALKSLGCRLALDDFGTGYSSLLHLQALPFDKLKVDRSFVNRMTEQRDCRKIVAAVVGLGQSLGLTTVAEGVETVEQAEMLRWLGCELGQGWLYGRPTPAAELEAVVSASRQKMNVNFSKEFAGRVSISSMDHLPAQRLAQLQAVYDGAPVGLGFLDRNMRYVNVNRTLAAMNGRSMAEHLGRTVPEIIPELYPTVEPYIRRALNGESVPGIEITKPANGANPNKTVLLTYEPARDEAGEVVGVSVALVDLTPIKHAEQAWRESEEHFRHMMEHLPQIPWIIDPEGRALDVSQRWLEITGTSNDEWRGFGWMDALHPDDAEPTMAGMQESFKTGLPIDLEYRVRKSENSPWVRLRARGSARKGADGKIVCWYGLLEPVGERR